MRRQSKRKNGDSGTALILDPRTEPFGVEVEAKTKKKRTSFFLFFQKKKNLKQSNRVERASTKQRSMIIRLSYARQTVQREPDRAGNRGSEMMREKERKRERERERGKRIRK